MSLMRSLAGRLAGEAERGLPIHDVNTYAQAVSAFGYSGLSYPHMPGQQQPQLVQTMPGERAEPIRDNFVGLVQGAYKANGVVFACMLARQLAFSSVRFSMQRLNVGKPSELFGTRALELLEEPWLGGTTQDLLARMIQDADLAGNSYWTESGGELVRLRPDWCWIIARRRLAAGLADEQGRPTEATLGWEKLGVVYIEGGSESDEEPVWVPVDRLAHFAPIPDPEANFRGMSWLTPVIREVQADQVMTSHRRKFFENGATPNMVLKHAEGATPEKVKAFADMMKDEFEGVQNAYKTLHLYPGADATVVGASLREIEFKVTQGGGETRIAAAARIPPIIVGLSEGLQAATYSNYGQARRAFADGTMHPLWGNAAGSFTPLLRSALRAEETRGGRNGRVRLWYDARDVPLLREDAKEQAEITEMEARTIRTLVDGGYTPDSAQRAVAAKDFALLKHTGLFSVQLQKPGTEQAGEQAPPAEPGQTDTTENDEGTQA